MKVIQKYFLALVPPTEILEKATAIKLLIREEFGIKYALKSPPHVTLKMPFSYNEAKEDFLERKLSDFLQVQKPFRIKVEGVGTFGNRVIYLGIKQTPEMQLLQANLKSFCKKELNLIDELSDRNYHPHLTVAFKDLKPNHFSEVLSLVKNHSFDAEYEATDLGVLKRKEGKWSLDRKLPFRG